MRTRTKSIVTALVLLSLVSGAIGCRSNGTGAWYNPKSYSWHNPFKGGEAPPYRAEEAQAANPKPSMDAKPNVVTPPGGYAKPGESDFFAGGQKAVQTQYGINNEQNRVASTTYPATENAMAGYSTPETAYSPYPAAPMDANAMNSYQPTRYQQPYEQPQQPQQPQQQQPVIINNIPEAQLPYGAPAVEHQPTYGAPATGAYGAPATTVPYGNTQATYGVPAATPQNVDPMANGYGGYGGGYTANPSSYQPTTTGGF